MNIQYTDLKGEYFLLWHASITETLLIHPLGPSYVLRASVRTTDVNSTFEVTINENSFEDCVLRCGAETLLIEDCAAFVRENVTRQMLVPSTEIFRNWILEYGVDITPLVKYYPDLEKFVKPWYCKII